MWYIVHMTGRELISTSKVHDDAMKALQPAINAWLSLQGSAKSSKTYAESLNRVNMVVPYNSMLAIDRPTARSIMDTLSRKYSISTLRVTMSAMSSLWNYLIDELGIVDHNPWQHLKLPRPKDTLPERLLTRDEVEAIIEAAEPGRDRCFIRFLYGTGLRLNEAMTVKWSDIRWDDDGRCWMTVYGKGSKTRVVEVDAVIASDLIGLWEGQALAGPLWGFSYRTGEKILERYRDVINKPVSPHWMRHARATHAFRNGAPIHLVQQNLGHASAGTTMRYVHAMPGESDLGYMPPL